MVDCVCSIVLCGVCKVSPGKATPHGCLLMFVGSRFVQVGQMSEMHVKDIERLHLKEFVLNDLYTNVSNLWFGLDSWIQFGKAAVAGIACLGVLIGLCVVRDVPRLGEHKWNAERCISCSSCCVYLFENHSKYLQVLRTCKLFDSWARLRLPRSTGIDSARGLSCGLLFLVGQAMETWKHGKTWNDGKTCVFSSFDFRQVAIAEFLVGVTSQAGSHWDSRRKMAESHSSLEQFEHKDVPVKPIKLKIAQSWEYPQDSQDPARKRLRFYWFTGFTLSSQRSAGLEEILAIFGHWRCLYCYCCPVLGSQVRSNLMPGLQF